MMNSSEWLLKKPGTVLLTSLQLPRRRGSICRDKRMMSVEFEKGAGK